MSCTRLVLRACTRIAAPHYYRRQLSCVSKLQPWRPTKDDVQRLSQGQAAKKRGVGSREVPHRLNTDEAKVFQVSKVKGVLVLRGSGYRRERKGSPLANTYRQWCDALAMPCIIVKQDTQEGLDTVLVDLSTLRTTRLAEVEAACHAAASELGCSPAEHSQLQAPFTVLIPLGSSSQAVAPVEAAAAAPAAAALEEAAVPMAVAAGAAGAVREEAAEPPRGTAQSASPVGSSGDEQPAGPPASSTAALPSISMSTITGSASCGQGPWQQQQQQQGPGAEAARGGSAVQPASPKPGGIEIVEIEQPTELMLTAPIWRQPPCLVGYQADRTTAKALAKRLAAQLLNKGV